MANTKPTKPNKPKKDLSERAKENIYASQKTKESILDKLNNQGYGGSFELPEDDKHSGLLRGVSSDINLDPNQDERTSKIYDPKYAGRGGFGDAEAPSVLNSQIVEIDYMTYFSWLRRAYRHYERPRKSTVNSLKRYTDKIKNPVQQRSQTSDPKKNAYLVFGAPGLGKSEIARDVARSIAIEENKIFLVWNDLIRVEQVELLKNPEELEKYFLMIDVRVSQKTKEDIAGIPKLGAVVDYMESHLPTWVFLVNQPKIDGYLFLDEFNHGDEDVLKSMFQIINERQAGDVRINRNIAIIAAGNIGAGFERNTPLDSALMDRFIVGYLVTDPKKWIEYATRVGVDERILAFVAASPEKHFMGEPQEDDKHASPRGFIKLSDAIANLEDDWLEAIEYGETDTVFGGKNIYQEIVNAAGGICGTNWTHAFKAFCAHWQLFKWDDITKNPRKHTNNGEENEQEARYAVTTYSVNIIKNLIKEWKKLEAKGELTKPEDIRMKMSVVRGVAEYVAFLSVLDDETLAYTVNALKWTDIDAFHYFTNVILEDGSWHELLIDKNGSLLYPDPKDNTQLINRDRERVPINNALSLYEEFNKLMAKLEKMLICASKDELDHHQQSLDDAQRDADEEIARQQQTEEEEEI